MTTEPALKQTGAATAPAAVTAQPALRLVHITKQFGNVNAVDDVSLEVQPGEVFTLLGPSGCGKTTTLRMLAGLETPDAGDLYFGDRTIVSTGRGIYVPSHKRRLGMVFQSYAIWPHMTVYENVAYPLKVRGIKGATARQQVRKALELVGLAGLEDRQAPMLSGGQQQRVALARAIVHEPSLLLLDEPFSNLDAKLREQTRVQLKLLLNELRITAVFVTHDQVEALSLSDRLAVMQAGRVEQMGTPQQLYEAPATPFVRDFLGRTLLLDGVLREDRRILLASAQAAPLQVPPAAVEGLAPGAGVTVAIRPEALRVERVARDATHENCLVGLVETALFVGDHYDCQVRVGEQSVLVPAPVALRLMQGDYIELKLDAEALHVWPH